MTQDQALAILKTGKNVFLTGEPGSGKTYTVNAYVAYLRSCGIEPAITASTGIAATHIDGMTIHSWSGIGINKTLSRHQLQEMGSQERLSRRMTSTHVLIIDEISMLDGRTLGLVDAVCRAIRSFDKPFGGMQMVFVGDFFQLPPVARQDDPPPEFAFACDAWTQAQPVVCYLSEHHRQEDERFLEILRALRTGIVSQAQRAMLLARQISFTQERLAAGIPKLFPHNNRVDHLNNAELQKLPRGSYTFTMSSRGPKPLVEQLKRGCLSPEKLVLKKDARVMFTKNSMEGNFVNGTLGIVQSFKKENGLPIVRTNSGKILIVESVQWSMITDGQIRASIHQLPLRLAWAMTVHKSQGMSLDAAYVDLSQAFVCGQGYVALSRVRTLEGLHLGGLNDRALEVSQEVLAQDQEFRQQSDSAISTLASLSRNELVAIQEAFLSACGASMTAEQTTNKTAKPKKQRRWEQTLALICSGLDVEQVAKKRGRTVGTIIEHLEELHKLGKLPVADMTHLRTKEDEAISKIHLAFPTLGTERLKPIYDNFKGHFSYDTIRLARLFFVNE